MDKTTIEAEALASMKRLSIKEAESVYVEATRNGGFAIFYISIHDHPRDLGFVDNHFETREDAQTILDTLITNTRSKFAIS